MDCKKIVPAVLLTLGVTAQLAANAEIFQMTEVSGHGAQLAAAESKCGAGSCGAAKPGEVKKDGEHKCGAHKCGAHKCGSGKDAAHKCGGKKDAEHKCAAHKCGGQKDAEHKCGAKKGAAPGQGAAPKVKDEHKKSDAAETHSKESKATEQKEHNMHQEAHQYVPKTQTTEANKK